VGARGGGLQTDRPPRRDRIHAPGGLRTVVVGRHRTLLGLGDAADIHALAIVDMHLEVLQPGGQPFGPRLGLGHDDADGQERRLAAWTRLEDLINRDVLHRITREIGLEEVIDTVPGFLRGEVTGRIVVDVNR